MERTSSNEGRRVDLMAAQGHESGSTGSVSSRINAMIAAMAIGAATLSAGCADDRAVYLDDTNDSGTGGNDAVGGSGGSGGYDAVGGSGGETSVNLPGADRKDVWQTFSFNIKEADAYDTMQFYRDQDNQLIACAKSEECMKDALYDNEGRAFQFLGEGSYSESRPGELFGICEYRTRSCGPDVGFQAGYDCKDSDGDSRNCTLAGVLKLSDVGSGSPEAEIPASHVVNIGFEESLGDECEPVVFCFGAEHGISFDDNGVYTMAFNPNLTVNTGKSLQINSASYKGLPKTRE